MKNKILITATLFLVNTTLFSQENELPENGNVGIGTTNPTEKLDVRGGAKIDSTLRVGDSIVISNSARVGEDLRVNGNAYIEGNLNVSGEVNLSNGPVNFSCLLDTPMMESEVLLLDVTGKVKRGGTAKDLVYGPVPQVMPCLTDGNGNTIYSSPYWQNGQQTMFLLNNTCSPDVKLGVGLIPTAKVHIKTSDDLLPETKAIIVENKMGSKVFQVNSNGLVYAREVKVNLDQQWPDYVFEDSYDLPSLEEVKSYIEQNNHLPNVPSANVMEQNGVNVSETSVMLMEKVEELTLYLIQLQEQLNQQQELLLKQQELIKKLEEQQK